MAQKPTPRNTPQPATPQTPQNEVWTGPDPFASVRGKALVGNEWKGIGYWRNKGTWPHTR